MFSVEDRIHQGKLDDLLEGEGRGPKIHYYRLIDRQATDFYLKGTENTFQPQGLETCKRRKLHSNSFYAQWFDPKKKDLGYKKVAIRYRRDSESVLPQEQERNGSEANPELDSIYFVWGNLMVEESGDGLAIVEYLSKHSGNVTNPDRIPSATEIFEEIFPELEAETSLDLDYQRHEVETYLMTMVRKTSEGFTYDSARLSALCNFFSITATTEAGRMQALVNTGKFFREGPAAFLRKAREFENAVQLNISHAEQLGVIKVGGGKAEYVAKDKIIKTFNATLSRDKVISLLGSWFATTEGEVAYKELLVELDAAKEKNIK